MIGGAIVVDAHEAVNGRSADVDDDGCDCNDDDDDGSGDEGHDSGGEEKHV